jgi:hypothetical protein
MMEPGGSCGVEMRCYAARVLRGLAGMLGVWAVGAVVLRLTVAAPEYCPPISEPEAMAAARASADWIARVQRPDGTYLYEYDRDADAEVPGYNVVRHAGVTMSLYQFAAEGELSALEPADRGLAWMEVNLSRYDGWAALTNPADGGIELGGNALLLAGLAQRRIATNDPTYDTLMHEVARFILVMQQQDGSFLLAWIPQTGQPDPSRRSKYATGEAFWALTLMHRLFPGEGWDVPSRKVADYLSLYRDTVEEQKFPPWADQWAAYGLSEMATWPLNEANVRYARTLAERFGFLVRTESHRSESWLSKALHGRRARAAGMGTWSEALDSLWLLASIEPRMADMRPKLAERAVCAAGMLADRQVTAAEASRSADAALTEGAWFTEGSTRMDDQQHALSGLIRAAPIIRESKAGRR